MSVWFITGASRGLGAEIARAALAAGHDVVATGRSRADIPHASLALTLDVTDSGSVDAAVSAAVSRFGRIDVLVNNAGRGLVGAVEEASDSVVRAVFDTNVFGLLNVTRAVLPVMRAQRSGHVVNMSSVGGFATGPGWGVYGATKYAVEGLSDALYGELAPLGIHVTVVEPGRFRTDFLDSSSLHVADGLIDDYAGTAGATRSSVSDDNHAQPGDPALAAAALLAVVGAEVPPRRIQLGSDSVARVEAKLELMQREISAWRSVSLSTDHVS